MNVVSKKALRTFWAREPRARKSLEAWFKIASKANWNDHHDVKATFASIEIVGDNRIIFDIGGNKYRVIAHMSYTFRSMQIKFVGTHKEYDRIKDVEEV